MERVGRQEFCLDSEAAHILVCLFMDGFASRQYLILKIMSGRK